MIKVGKQINGERERGEFRDYEEEPLMRLECDEREKFRCEAILICGCRGAKQLENEKINGRGTMKTNGILYWMNLTGGQAFAVGVGSCWPTISRMTWA